MKLVRYIAVDKDGSIYAFDDKPIRNGEEGIWWCKEGAKLTDCLNNVKDLMPLETSKRTWADEPLKVIIDYQVGSIRPVKQKRFENLN